MHDLRQLPDLARMEPLSKEDPGRRPSSTTASRTAAPQPAAVTAGVQADRARGQTIAERNMFDGLEESSGDGEEDVSAC